MKHLVDNNFSTNKLQNVPTPTNPYDAANKSYVDNKFEPVSIETINQASDYVAFGDSITAGKWATAEADKYVSLIAAAKGWSYTNKGVNGSRVTDSTFLDAIYATTVGYGDVFTSMIGVNNARLDGSDVTLANSFMGAHMATTAWLAIPDAYKIRASAATKTGTWTNNTGVYGGMNYYSTTNGSTIKAKIKGTVAYLGVDINPSKTGTFSVSIDGVVVGVYNTAVNTPTRDDSGTYGAYLLRFPGLDYGEHEVTVTVTSATGANNTVYVDWFGGNGFINESTGPNVYVGNVLRATDSFYAVGSPHSDAAVALYNTRVSNSVNSLAQDGLNVVLVDVVSSQNRSTMMDADGLHPNDLGHETIANEFINRMSSLVKAHDRGKAIASNTPWFYPTLLNSWVRFDTTYGQAAYMKDANGFVHLAGLVKSGSIGTVIFVLPPGFRPGSQRYFATGSGGAFGALRVNNAGEVIAQVGSPSSFSLDTAVFLAEA